MQRPIELGRVTFANGRVSHCALARAAGVCRHTARRFLRGEGVNPASAAVCRRALEKAGFSVVSSRPEEIESFRDEDLAAR